MEKSTVYFTDFRCKVGTSQLDKLKKLCIAAGIHDIDMNGKFVDIKIYAGNRAECHFSQTATPFIQEAAKMPLNIWIVPILTALIPLLPDARSL